MRILYLTQWFDPEPGVIKGPAFVTRLIEAGHQVTVVTGLPNYPIGRIYPGYRMRLLQKEQMEGFTVIRLPLYPSHDASSLRRALNYLSFFVSAFVYGLFRGGRYDLAYVYHPPITVGLAAALFGKLHKLKFVLEIQDLWPDSVAASGMAGTGQMARVIGQICDYVYRRSTRIIVQAEGMRKILVARGVPPTKIATIRNWADAAALRPQEAKEREALGLGRRFTILYGGNLGRAQALAAVIRAARQGGERADFEMLFMGDGIDLPMLKGLADEIGASNVRFLPRVSREEAAERLAAADALLIHLADHELFEVTIPSKTQFYLAMGKPILAGVRGEAAEILEESGAAIVVKPEDVDALAEGMVQLSGSTRERLRLMAENGRAYYQRELSFEKAMDATVLVLEAAV